MPPRSSINPAPRTESAMLARKAFFCELCQKGYARINEFEAHESSYDHQHKKRIKDMKVLQKDFGAADKARRNERKTDEKAGLVSIKLDAGSEKGVKKSGFKSAFGRPADAPPTKVSGFVKISGPETKQPVIEKDNAIADDASDVSSSEDDDYYDPAKPTGCTGGCGLIAS